MRIASKILKVLLAFWFISGGIYMMTHYPELATVWALDTFPEIFWVILGGIQILFALGLGLSAILKNFPAKLALISNIGLIVITLLGLAIFIAYAGFPGILWGILPAVLLVLVIREK